MCNLVTMLEVETKQQHSTLYKGFIILVINKVIKELSNHVTHSTINILHNTERQFSFSKMLSFVVKVHLNFTTFMICL